MRRLKLLLLTVIVAVASVCAFAFTACDGETEKHNLNLVPEKAAGCFEEGHEAYYECSHCDKLFEDEKGVTEITLDDIILDPLGHQPERVEEVAAGCETYGVAAHYKCTLCRRLFTDADGENEIMLSNLSVSPVGHNIAKVEEKHADCLTAGNTEYYTCYDCEKLFTDAEGTTETTIDKVIVDAKGHKTTLVPAVAAGCETGGNTAYYTCSGCDKLFEDKAGRKVTTLEQVTLAAKGHKTALVPAVEASCETAGNTAHYSCSGCDKLFADEAAKTVTTLAEVTLAAKGHNTTLVPAVEAGCETQGKNAYYTCSGCDKLFADEAAKTQTSEEQLTVNATGHKQIDAVAAKEATCTEKGSKEHFACADCGKTFSDADGKNAVPADQVILPALGHSMTKKGGSATCTQAGVIAHFECGRCNKLFLDENGERETTAEEVQSDSALGHDNKLVAEVAAGCETDGTEAHYNCARCGKLFTDENGTVETNLQALKISALGHDAQAVAEVAAGCETDGTEAHYECTRCDKLFKEQTAETETTLEELKIEAAGHTYKEFNQFSDGHSQTCTVCDKETEKQAHSSDSIDWGRADQLCKHCGYVMHEKLYTPFETPEQLTTGSSYGGATNVTDKTCGTGKSFDYENKTITGNWFNFSGKAGNLVIISGAGGGITGTGNGTPRMMAGMYFHNYGASDLTFKYFLDDSDVVRGTTDMITVKAGTTKYVEFIVNVQDFTGRPWARLILGADVTDAKLAIACFKAGTLADGAYRLALPDGVTFTDGTSDKLVTTELGNELLNELNITVPENSFGLCNYYNSKQTWLVTTNGKLNITMDGDLKLIPATKLTVEAEAKVTGTPPENESYTVITGTHNVEADKGAAGTPVVSNVKIGTKIDFYIYSETAISNANLVITAASLNRDIANNKTLDSHFNTMFKLSVEDEVVTVGDDVVIAGRSRVNDKESFWFLSTDNLITQVNLKAGFTKITIECVGEIVDSQDKARRVSSIDKIDINV